MTRAVTFTQAQVPSVVYFVQIGKHIKIGFTTNLKQRLKAFATSAHDVELLLAIPGGDRALERRLHEGFAESRLERELFRREGPILYFIRHFESRGLDFALEYMDATTPAARARSKIEDHAKRVALVRQTKAEKDAYFASLVAERKNRIGW